jgi:RecA/RadA recombinase
MEQIQQAAQAPPQLHERPIYFDQVVSTGSTILDLAISGRVTKYGGLPGRIIVQVYGPSGTGKTTLMAETLGHVQRAGGKYRIKDPEARLIPSYCKTFGVHLNQEEIERTGTITDMFETLIGPLVEKATPKGKVTKRDTSLAWTPDPSHINIYGVDALAALASKMEMVQGDKLGQKRAKDFSEGFRQISDHVYNHNILMFCTDQVRDNIDGYGEKQKPGGGNAVGFYASLRIRLKPMGPLTKEVQLPGMAKPEIHVYGIEVLAEIRKSSLDRSFRTAPLRLIFNYGYDDIGANLKWLQAHGAMRHPDDPTKVYAGYVIGDRRFPQNTPGGAFDAAVRFIENENMEDDIKEWVVELWNEIEDQVAPQRKPKAR